MIPNLNALWLPQTFNGIIEIGVTIFDQTVGANTDDAMERIVGGDSGKVVITLSDSRKLGQDGGDNNLCGFRFLNVTVPKNAMICTAYIKFTAEDTHAGVTNVDIYAQDADTTLTFVEGVGSFDLSARDKTTAKVDWDAIPAWTAGENGADTTSPEIKTCIQEVVNRGGWNSGNSMVILIEGSAGERRAESYLHDNAKSAELYIQYTP